FTTPRSSSVRNLLSLFLTLLRPPRSTLFPYTTLFRSGIINGYGIFDFRLFAGIGLAPPRSVHEPIVVEEVPVEEPECTQENLARSEEHTSELQSRENLVCRLLLEKKNKQKKETTTNKK